MDTSNDFDEAEFKHLKHCLADLLLIHEKAQLQRMSWQDVRTCALPLRRLFLDGGGEILRCWRLIGNLRRQFQIMAKELPSGAKHKEILVACGNYGNTPNRCQEEFGATISVPDGFADEEVYKIQRSIDHETESHSYLVAEYLSSICMSIYGIPITRQNVLKYVANKAGGVHVDTRPRNPDEKEYEAFDALDKHAGKIWMNGKSLPYLEVQAITGQLMGSPDTEELSDVLNTKLGDHVEWQFV